MKLVLFIWCLIDFIYSENLKKLQELDQEKLFKIIKLTCKTSLLQLLHSFGLHRYAWIQTRTIRNIRAVILFCGSKVGWKGAKEDFKINS